MERRGSLGTWAGPGYLPVKWTLPDLEASLRRRCRHRSLLSVLFSELRNLERTYVRAFALLVALATTVPTALQNPHLSFPLAYFIRSLPSSLLFTSIHKSKSSTPSTISQGCSARMKRRKKILSSLEKRLEKRVYRTFVTNNV